MPVTPAGIAAEQAEDAAVARLLTAVHAVVIEHAPVRPTAILSHLTGNADATERTVREAVWQLLDNDVVRLDTNLALILPGSLAGL
jgi:hypothetical protein